MFLTLTLVTLFTQTILAQDTNPCKSFGVDYQDGGKYYQNIISNNPFTFVSIFQGCEPDFANNILVDPAGTQYLCSDTELTPSDTPEMSTCPLNNTQLSNGPWSVIILSNNGNAQPIAYQRDFSLSVGPQSTLTMTPTVTANITSTPIANITQITTATNITTLVPATLTSPSVVIIPTRYITPRPVTATATKVLYTVSRVVPKATVTKVTKMITPTCKVPRRQQTPDKKCRIRPTIISAAAFDNVPTFIPPTITKAPSLLVTATWSSSSSTVPAKASIVAKGLQWPPNNNNKWGSMFGNTAGRPGRFFWPRDLEDMPTFLAKREARLKAMGALEKRAPDEATITVTEADTAVWPTVTSTIFAPTQYSTVTSVLYVVSTMTPSPVVVYAGESTAQRVTVTVPVSTRLVTKYTVVYQYTTRMQTYTQTITSTAPPPPASITACKKLGGRLVRDDGR